MTSNAPGGGSEKARQVELESGTAATAAEDRAHRSALVRLVAIGGSAVLASYLLAFDPEIGGKLWGGVPEGWVRDFYTVNMLLAAFGFFPATYWLGFATPASALRARTGFGIEVLLVCYAAILMASALWLPLTALYVKTPSNVLWLLIRTVLIIVGAGASVLWLMLVRRAAGGPLGARLAVVAFFFFWLQTMVLDALVWPYFYSA